ncbi:MAG: cell wall-binding repeat-containing protein [Peptacetobacter hiranonis]|nr:cell wall-binding repeat-containing protein [Peptacetobacter hiranonis]
MNKKRLSVVMAGAMLASSVAPVLAADSTNEVSQGRLGLLIDRLETLMDSKKFDANDRKDGKPTQFAGKSAYAIQILKNGDVKTPIIDGADLTIDLSAKQDGSKEIRLYSSKTFAAALKSIASDFDNAEFYTVKVYEIGNTKENGKIVSTKVTEKEEIVPEVYDEASFEQLLDDVEAINDGVSSTNPTTYPGLKSAVDKNWITKLEVSEDNKKVIISLGSKDADGKFNKIECKIDSPSLIFNNPVDKDGKAISNMDDTYIQANIAGFEYRADKTIPAGRRVSIAGKEAKVAHEVKIVNGDMNYTVKVDDLYDGFMLTEKGHELMNAVKLYNKNKGFLPNNNNGVNINGTERSFNIEFTINGTKHIVKVVGDSLHEGRIKTLKTWLWNKKANVELLAGENRYATAVEIAKTYLAGDSQYTWAQNSELVLVNGEALVDGLAAAPYSKEKGAPILLTETNSLPAETKAYMKELIAEKQIGNLNNKDITVTIIGGDSVVSNSVVRELKEIGFKVKRISGEDREETSLAVAHKLANKTNKAFLVGANGEADAMSIAAAAAKAGNPIIVAASEKTGLSTDGLNEVSEYAEVKIIGGDGVVPESTEKELKELIADATKVTRLNGKDRQETNALVIKNYHPSFTDALIAKDGSKNKSELVDALPAALFASSNAATNPAAPIVLATDSISEEQLNQLALNSNKAATGTVYQIGNGVARSVMEKVVTRLGLNN